MNKLLLGLVVTCIYTANQVNATNQNYNQKAKSTILNSPKYAEDFDEMIDEYIEANYSNCNMITKDVEQKCWEWGSHIDKPKGHNKYTLQYQFLNNTYEIVLIKLLYRIISNIDKNKIENWEYPICICDCNVKTKDDGLIYKLSSTIKDNENTKNIKLYRNKQGHLFVDYAKIGTYDPIKHKQQIEKLTDEKLNDMINVLLKISKMQFNIQENNDRIKFQYLVENNLFHNMHCSILNSLEPIYQVINKIESNKQILIVDKLSIFELLTNFYDYQTIHANYYLSTNKDCEEYFAPYGNWYKLRNTYAQLYKMCSSIKTPIENEYNKQINEELSNIARELGNDGTIVESDDDKDDF